jgi:hypothetical protein
MESHGEKVMFAAITAPLAVVPTSAAWAVWYYATSPRSTPDALVFPDPDKPWEFVLLFSMYGMFTAYLSLPIFVSLYYGIRHFSFISYPAMIVAGLFTCIPAAFFYGRSHDFARILVFLLPFGAAVAALFLWMMRRNAEPSAARVSCWELHSAQYGRKLTFPTRSSAPESSFQSLREQ